MAHRERARGLSTKAIGTAAELQVAGTLIELGLEVYAPLVDDKGVDLLVRRSDGTTEEIQVKSVRSGRWFQVTRWEDPRSAMKENRWVIGVENDGTSWLFPARTFFDATVSSVSGGHGKRYVYDLNLDTTRRGQRRTNGELLKVHRNAWDLLKR
jgi:hypothetical protein